MNLCGMHYYQAKWQKKWRAKRTKKFLAYFCVENQVKMIELNNFGAINRDITYIKAQKSPYLSIIIAYSHIFTGALGALFLALFNLPGRCGALGALYAAHAP